MSDPSSLSAAAPAPDGQRPAEVQLPVPELGGWVPAVGRAPVDDDLLSEWAPRAERGQHRTAGPDAPPGGDPSTDTRSRDEALEAGDDEALEAGDEPAADNRPPDPEQARNDGEPSTDEEGERAPGRARVHRINGRWGRFAELWVPESMREARVDPGRRGMLVLVLVAAVAAVVAAVGVWRDRPEPRPVETSFVAGASGAGSVAPGTVSDASASPAAATGGSGTAAGSDVAAPPSEILVSVTGLVTNPGVVRLPPDSRVADAIAAAGGTQPGADLTGTNLAARLADGDSVVVTDAPSATVDPGPSRRSDGSGGGSAPAAGLVDLNTADEAALDTLPGVGPVMAQNILAWRETNGKFASVEQLQEISGIGPSRYAQLAPLVTVG